MDDAQEPYAPKPGTVVYRALAMLEREGREMNASQLAEALVVDSGAVSANLATAVKHGLVVRRQLVDAPRAPFWYSLPGRVRTGGTGVIAPVPPAPPEIELPAPASAPAAAPAAPHPTVEAAPPPAPPEDSPAPMPTPDLPAAVAPSEASPEPPRTLTGVNATVSLTGELAVIADDGTVVLFKAALAQRVADFFARRAAS